jgi:ABC-type transporter Mla maintaining outer membrane lipid asymmetry ATPase subunit MlaF
VFEVPIVIESKKGAFGLVNIPQLLSSAIPNQAYPFFDLAAVLAFLGLTYLTVRTIVDSPNGVSLEVDNIFPSLTVRENMEMGGYFLNKSKSGEHIEKMFRLFPFLKERLTQKAGSLSGSERQMVAMGSALMVNPKLILLDDPSAGLSPAVTLSLFDKIKEINATGTAIFIVEQNAYESLEISSNWCLIPLTGSSAFGGKKELAGIEIAVDEINQFGGVLGGRKVEIIAEDTESRPKASL